MLFLNSKSFDTFKVETTTAASSPLSALHTSQLSLPENFKATASTYSRDFASLWLCCIPLQKMKDLHI